MCWHQAELLNSQLELIDPAFFRCAGFTDAPRAAPALERHLTAGLSARGGVDLVGAIARAWVPAGPDDELPQRARAKLALLAEADGIYVNTKVSFFKRELK